jgi:hypothetical protein
MSAGKGDTAQTEFDFSEFDTEGFVEILFFRYILT